MNSGAVEERKEASSAEAAGRKYVTFSMNEQEFGLPISEVREVIPAPRITRVFQTPRTVVGVTNLRGAILAVLDARIFLGLAPTVLTPESHLIVASVDEMLFSIVVDRMSRMKVFPLSAVEPPVPTMPESQAAHIEGIVQESTGPLAILNLRRIVRADEIRALYE